MNLNNWLLRTDSSLLCPVGPIGFSRAWLVAPAVWRLQSVAWVCSYFGIGFWSTIFTVLASCLMVVSVVSWMPQDAGQPHRFLAMCTEKCPSWGFCHHHGGNLDRPRDLTSWQGWEDRVLRTPKSPLSPHHRAFHSSPLTKQVHMLTCMRITSRGLG